MNLEEFRRELEKKMLENRAAFEGIYAAELEGLMGLSREEIDRLKPGGTDVETYDKLITVVREASRVNLKQADLKEQIEEMGELAVKIAKKVGPLAERLV